MRRRKLVIWEWLAKKNLKSKKVLKNVYIKWKFRFNYYHR